MRRLKWILLAILLILLLIIAYLGINMYSAKNYQIQENQISIEKPNSNIVNKLAEAVRFKTISYHDEKSDTTVFKAFHRFLETSFPKVFTQLDVQFINGLSILIKWEGADKSLKPMILMAHQDVVPVDSMNLKYWRHEPWSGTVVNDTIYGRGTLDDKGGLIAQLQALESLLEEGAKPNRTVYLASGHDEEISGMHGAHEIVQHLKKQGVQAEFVLDEGLYILEDFVPNVSDDVAFIGLAEKGYLSVELSAFVEGGHSSIPSRNNSIDAISNAIQKLRSQPLPATLTEPTHWFIKYLATEMPLLEKMAFANINLFENMVIGIYEETNTGNAIVRTTTAPTTFHAGVKDNVVPAQAKATINYRILPGDTKEQIMKYMKEVINDERVKLTVLDYNKPSRISCVECPSFQSIHKAIERIAPEALVAPNLMVGGSDSKHFEAIANSVYRFRPLRLNNSNINGIHGINERIAVYDYGRAIAFYKELILSQ